MSVMPKKGSPADEDKFREALSKLLVGYQMPREVIFVDQIPMMESGKVNYKLLETM